MSSTTAALRIAAILFGLVCIGHAWRVLAHMPVVIGSWSVPAWLSVLGAVVTGALSIWLFSLSRSR